MAIRGNHLEADFLDAGPIRCISAPVPVVGQGLDREYTVNARPLRVVARFDVDGVVTRIHLDCGTTGRLRWIHHRDHRPIFAVNLQRGAHVIRREAVVEGEVELAAVEEGIGYILVRVEVGIEPRRRVAVEARIVR